jgi:hypothetical protein
MLNVTMVGEGMKVSLNLRVKDEDMMIVLSA